MAKGLVFFSIFILCIGRSAWTGAQNNSKDSLQTNTLLSKLYVQKDDTIKVKILDDLAYLYHTTSPYDGIKYGNQALSLATQLHWDLGIARSNSALGANYYALSKFSEAYEYWVQALRINEKLDFKPGIANHLQNIGNIFFSQGNYSQALDNYRKALTKNQELGNKKSIANTYTVIGNIYAAQKDYPQALEYHNRALEIDAALNHDNDVAADLMNIGSVYSDYGQYAKALVCLFKALEVKKSSGDKNGIARVYGIIGKNFLRVANDTAGRKIEKERIAAERKKELLQSIAYLDSAIHIDEEIGFLDNLQKNSRYLSEAQETLQNYKEALASYKRYSSLKDSIYSTANTEKIFITQRKGEIEAKDNEIKMINFEIRRKQAEHKYFIIGIGLLFIIIGLLAIVIKVVLRNYATQKKSNHVITIEKKKSEDLLLNILPAEVANELKENGTAEARYFDNVTILFTDFVGFTKISERLTPRELVEELNVCFSAFDRIMDKYAIEKIKTIGDAYLAVSGLPVATPGHAACVVSAAIEISRFIGERKKQLGDKAFEIRIGAHSGNVVAGIVGIKKFAYDIWGDTVNTAARMEQNSEAGRINISQTTYELVKDRFSCTYRGMIAAKNKGELQMYFVEDKHDK